MSAELQSNKGILKRDETNVGGIKNVAIVVRVLMLVESCRARTAR